MKIVVTGTRGIPDVMGGVETHCEELFPRLVELGYDITVIRRSAYVHDALNDWHGVKLVDIPAPKHKSFEAIIHTIKAFRYAKKIGADVVHVHSIGPALGIPYGKWNGQKVVFTHHGPDYMREKWGWLAKRILQLGEYFAAKYADRMIVISEEIRNIIACKYGRVKDVSLIYNGVQPPEYCFDHEYFKALGIKQNRYVLGMSRIVPEKNLHHLIEAFNLLKEENRIPANFKLVIAGDSDFDDRYSHKLKEKARKSGVVLTGFVKGRRLHSLLTNCCCYCLPSSHEGLPIALLEAMSYNLPVVVSDIAPNLEVKLPQDCYFKCGDVRALADGIEKWINKGKSVRVDYDLTPYDWDCIARQVAEVYESLR